MLDLKSSVKHVERNAKGGHLMFDKKEYNRLYSQRMWREFPEKVKESQRKYRKKHLVKILARERRYRQTHRAECVARAKEYDRTHPWSKDYRDLVNRCTNPKRKDWKLYGGRGITFAITSADLKRLWFRDEAWKFKRASVDRINSDGNYTPENCRYIEHSKNAHYGGKNRWKGVSTK